VTAHDGYEPVRRFLQKQGRTDIVGMDTTSTDVMVRDGSLWLDVPAWLTLDDDGAPSIAALAQSLYDRLKGEPWLDSVRGRLKGDWRGLRVYIGKHWNGPDPAFIPEWKGVPVEYCDMRWTQEMSHEAFRRGIPRPTPEQKEAIRNEFQGDER
jgi:hypothetical protein